MPGKRARTYLTVGWNHFWRQLWKVAHNPIFLILTLVGNSTWIICSLLFYFVEYGRNPAVNSWFDAVWWAVITMTTVGYGDIVPTTGWGRLIAVALILSGGVLFLSFIALLSSAFVELEFIELEQEVRALRKRMSQVIQHIDLKDEDQK